MPGSSLVRVVLTFLMLMLAGCAASTPESPAVEDLPVDGVPDALPDCLVVHGLEHPCLQEGLRMGQGVFWNGSALPLGNAASLLDNACGDPVAGNAHYELPIGDVPQGARLHVGVQVYIPDLNHVRPFADTLHMGHETGIDAALYAPDGRCVARGSADGLFGFALDAAAEAGTWQIRIDGTLPEVLEYRMRAHVHGDDVAGEPALPDLRILAPFEVSFFVPTATILPGAPLPVGLHGASCMAEEIQEAIMAGIPVPTLCLRFSMGIYNSADVPLVLRAERSGIMADAGLEDVPLTQVMCNADATVCQDLEPVEGMVSRWHQTHLHYHYQNAYIFDLYRVEGEELVQVGTSGKLGLDPTNEAWDAWFSFHQGSQWGSTARYADGSAVPVSQRVQPGWGDVYDWNRAGNYIDFPSEAGLPVPGEYIIQGITDPLDQVRESNETNNAAYIHFEVTGVGAVNVLERGFGLDPWDPAKEVLTVAP